MKRSSRISWLLATAASMALAGVAPAQYRVGTDGRALDASNQVGANGYNGGLYQQQSVTPGNYINNDLITGNITGGKQFRGNIPYTAPDAFRGTLPGAGVDRFMSQSAGVPSGYGAAQYNTQTVQPFFGSSYGAPPPTGYVQQAPGSGAFVPPPSASMMTRQPGDLRMGETLDQPTNFLPPPGQLLLPGPVDPNTQTSTVITASPLYGVRQWNPYSQEGQAFFSDNMGQNGYNSLNQRFDSTTLQRMRDEVMQAGTVNPTQQQNQATDENGNPKPQNPQSLDNGASNTMSSPQNPSLSTGASLRSNNRVGSGSLSSDVDTGASVRSQPRLLMPPEQQSTQYAELRRRLEQNRTASAIEETATSNKVKPSAQTKDKNNPAGGTKLNTIPIPGPNIGQPAQQDNSQPGMPAQPQLIQPGNPSGGAQDQSNPLMPGSVPMPAIPVPNANALPVPRPAPLQIHSLAQGIQAKGLADLLKEGEDQMKQGHFNSAIDEFDLAERVAPNNPFTLLDRAIAELGQSYYGTAESHLRQVFTAKPELLMGQYDLPALLGNDRLDFLVKELREMSTSNQKETRPVFLLAFIAYNTGHERQAAAYLDLAEKRSSGKDDLYNLIRKNWSLPQDSQPGQENK